MGWGVLRGRQEVERVNEVWAGEAGFFFLSYKNVSNLNYQRRPGLCFGTILQSG